MKELLLQYASYNTWANRRLTGCICALPDELQVIEVPSSFNSLYRTLLHMWNAESIWWQRIKMQEIVTPPDTNFTGTTAGLASALLQQDKTWEAWVDSATPAAIAHVFYYQNTKREQFRQPVYEVLLHLFNHNTYHRGQSVTILRALGIENIPATDFILWSRGKK